MKFRIALLLAAVSMAVPAKESLLGKIAEKSRYVNAYGECLGTEFTVPDFSRLPKGRLHIFPLTARCIAVAGDYNRPLIEAVRTNYRERLTVSDRRFAEKKLQGWAHAFFYNFAAKEVDAGYQKTIRDRFNEHGWLAMTVNGAPARIAKEDNWPHCVGLMRIPSIDGASIMMTPVAEIVHMKYILLEKPLSNGDRVEFASKDGTLSGKFTFSDETLVSRAVKVNQTGYLADAGKKYAYFGMWLGALGAMPVEEFRNSEFRLVRNSDGAVVFTGKMTLRSEEQYYRLNSKDKKTGAVETIPLPLNGETTLQLDFSEFRTPGVYHIQIPGVGSSWSFVIGPDAVGKAFYVNARGLFHQRSGIARTKEYTNWTFAADHRSSWLGGFPPNDRQYGGKGSCFVDSAGKVPKLRHFEVVAATATETELKNVYGGWWDAGDFDRRTYHFLIVEGLLSAYLADPAKFTDGQLDIPESGNGIPDIVDEAAWGVDVWRRAQNEAGGVGCWLEATSHPLDPNPDTDVQRYYLALPTRESTLEYAAFAAKLARAYRAAGSMEKAGLFYSSAVRAWNYAMNPANRIVKKFTIPKRGEFTYTEPEKLSEPLLFKSAVSLWLYQKDPAYRPYVENRELLERSMAYIRLFQRPFFLSELSEAGDALPHQTTRYRETVLKRADEYLQSQEELAYRNIEWPISSAFFLNLAWGNAIPTVKGAYFVMAWKLTGEEKYRSAALLLADWMQGANPMGRSMTTGLGKVYPVRLLSLPAYTREKKYVEPPPGITPYTFTGMNARTASSAIFQLEWNPRGDMHYAGCSVTLLPDSVTRGKEMTGDECRKYIGRTIPIWRRFANMEGFSVAQNEFSVWETIGPSAAFMAFLLPNGWKPNPDWKKIEPKKDLYELPGYIFLP